MRERKYDDAGLTPKERFRERQSLETKELLIELRSQLDSELLKDSEFRSQYYREALNYLNRFWKELFAYLDDGELPIDNNLAERTIRKLTTQRNNSLHYGSDAGAEMAATYHSVIGTVKLHGSSVWNLSLIHIYLKNIATSYTASVSVKSIKSLERAALLLEDFFLKINLEYYAPVLSLAKVYVKVHSMKMCIRDSTYSLRCCCLLLH